MNDVLISFFHDDIHKINEMSVLYQSTQKIYSKHTLVNLIVNGEIFNKYYSQVVDELLTKVFGTDFDTKKMNSFKEMFHKNVTLLNQSFDKMALQDFLKESPEFNTHFEKRIAELYFYYTETNISDENMKTLIHKVKAIDFMDENDSDTKEDVVVKLIKELIDSQDVEYVEHTESEDPFVNYFNTRYMHAFKTQTKPSSSELCEFKRFRESKEFLVDAYLQTRCSSYDPVFLKIVDTFLELFEREMTVFEYRKYCQLASLNDSRNVLENYHKLFNDKYYIASNLYKLYFDDILNHHVFCRTFLDYVDLTNEEFCQNVIDIMIRTDKYSNVMNKKIASIYKNSFADDISEIDAAYFFSEILKKKLNLEDEELPQTISQLKDQTEQHINTLNTVFNNVLHRDADVFEKEHYIFYFRDGYTNNGKAQIADCRYKSSIRIENELYDSMEYQDVLKEWLKDSLKIKNHSVLYKVMLYITKLEDKELIRNKNNLLEGLKKVFENYF
jgi:hypothetical protein